MAYTNALDYSWIGVLSQGTPATPVILPQVTTSGSVLILTSPSQGTLSTPVILPNTYINGNIVSVYSWIPSGSGSAYFLTAIQLSWLTPYVPSIIEAASAVATPSATAIFLVSITEAASATDTQSAGMLYAVSISEIASATDTPAATAIFLLSTIETGSAEDFPSTIAIFIVTINEEGIAVDFPSVIAIFIVSRSEIISANDLEDGIIIHPTASILHLYNGLQIVTSNIQTDWAVRCMVGPVKMYSNVITATDDRAGCVRIKANGVVKALQLTV